MDSTFNENDIRPVELMDEQARCFANDIARLMRHQNDFVRVSCPACDQPVCNQNEEIRAFEKYGMRFSRCTRCETIYANPRPRPEHMAEYYRESENYAYWNQTIFPASVEARREKIFRPRVERVLDICQRYQLGNDTLLEVGAGFGIFCEEVQKTGIFKKVIAVEPTPNLAQTCRDRGLITIEKSIEQVIPADITPLKENIDVIASFEVIEHLFSPRDFLQKCAGLLQIGGMLILTCPNGLGFDIDLMGAVSTSVDVEHVNLFNPQSLSVLMQACGFEVIETQTPGRLDAELVRNKVLSGEFSLSGQPFLKKLLIDDWERHGQSLQDFLVQQQLSSHMLLVARKL